MKICETCYFFSSDYCTLHEERKSYKSTCNDYTQDETVIDLGNELRFNEFAKDYRSGHYLSELEVLPS